MGAPQPTEKGAGDPQAVQQKGGQPLDRRKTAEALDSAADAGSPAGAGRQPPETPEAAARHCELYCALCTKRHALLRGLFTAYAASGEGGRAAVLKNADGLARVLGPQAPTLIALIDNTPPGALSLLVRMLFFLTESQPAPQASFPVLTLGRALLARLLVFHAAGRCSPILICCTVQDAK